MGLPDFIADYVYDISTRYRLSPTELFKLIQEKFGTDPDLERIIEVEDKGYWNQVYRIYKKHGKQFVICPMSKDNEDAQVERSLPFCLNVIENFYQALTPKAQQQEYTLLVPLYLCRKYFNFKEFLPQIIWEKLDALGTYSRKRAHAVLLEVRLTPASTLSLGEIHLSVIDSKTRLPTIVYPDTFAELAANDASLLGKKIIYDGYSGLGMQETSFTCGDHLLEFMQEILRSGNSDGCKNVRLPVMEKDIPRKYFDRLDHLRGVYGVDTQKFIDIVDAMIAFDIKDMPEPNSQGEDFEIYVEVEPKESLNSPQRSPSRSPSPLLASTIFVTSSIDGNRMIVSVEEEVSSTAYTAP